MAEVCYTARATTKQQVLNKINILTLQTNEHKQYTHGAILLFQKDVQRVLVSQFNPSDPVKSMVKLLDDGNNILMRVKSTYAITAGSVIKLAKNERTKSQKRPAKPSSLTSPHEWRHRKKLTN